MISKAAFDHIESEIRDYSSSLQELDYLEGCILGDRENTPSHTGRIVSATLAIQVKYNHIAEVLKSINLAFAELPENTKRVIESIYWSNPNKPITTSEEEKCRNSFVNRIAALLGWR